MTEPLPYFVGESDFTLEILRTLKKKGYKRYSPKRDLRCGTPEWREDNKDMRAYFAGSWNWWTDPIGEVVPAFVMLFNCNIKLK